MMLPMESIGFAAKEQKLQTNPILNNWITCIIFKRHYNCHK